MNLDDELKTEPEQEAPNAETHDLQELAQRLRESSPLPATHAAQQPKLPDDAGQLLQQIIEGALLASAKVLTIEQLQALFDEGAEPAKADVKEALQAIQSNCAERGFELIELSSGWRLQVRQQLSPWVSRLWEEKPQRYSRALLETLALVAYRQPITRGEIEEVRGVAVSSNIMRTLLERQWVRVVGHRDVPGRPAMYATTKDFLDYFNLQGLESLPSLADLKDLNDSNQELDLGDEQTETPAAEQEQSTEQHGDEIAALGVAEGSDEATLAETLSKPNPEQALEDFSNSDQGLDDSPEVTTPTEQNERLQAISDKFARQHQHDEEK